jgi:cytochrome c556
MTSPEMEPDVGPKNGKRKLAFKASPSAIVLGLACLTLGVAVAAATPADLIKVRQQNYKQIGRSTKAIFDELKGSQPNVASVQANARIVAALAHQLPTWFPQGTGPEAGVKTAALPAVWQQKAEFAKDASNFEMAARQLSAVSAKGSVADIQAAAGVMGGTCKACHQTFRAKD